MHRDYVILRSEATKNLPLPLLCHPEWLFHRRIAVVYHPERSEGNITVRRNIVPNFDSLHVRGSPFIRDIIIYSYNMAIKRMRYEWHKQ